VSCRWQFDALWSSVHTKASLNIPGYDSCRHMERILNFYVREDVWRPSDAQHCIACRATIILKRPYPLLPLPYLFTPMCLGVEMCERQTDRQEYRACESELTESLKYEYEWFWLNERIRRLTCFCNHLSHRISPFLYLVSWWIFWEFKRGQKLVI
jgi:hypothetical protein